jgi:uncharacterized membrane protein
VVFGDATTTNTTVSFSAPGVYTLELSANDGVHAVAYSAVVFTAINAVSVSMAQTGTNVTLNWQGGAAPYVVQQTAVLPAVSWTAVATTSLQSISVPITNQAEFFSIESQ